MTHDQIESIRIAQKQLLDLGDSKTAALLDWAVTAEPSEPWSVEAGWSGEGHQVRMWVVRRGDLEFPFFNLSDANRLVGLLNSPTGKCVPRKYLGKDGSPRICEEGYGAALPSPIEADRTEREAFIRWSFMTTGELSPAQLKFVNGEDDAIHYQRSAEWLAWSARASFDKKVIA